MILSICSNPSIDTYAWLSNFNKGEVNRIEKQKEYPGGKGTHIALALAELRTESKLMGNWAGNAGKWIKNACEQKNVSITGVELSGSNRKCYTFRSSDPNFDNSELLETGPEMDKQYWKDFKNIFAQEIKKASLVCMSGSWPKNASPWAYRQLIEITNNQNINVLLDCSGTQLTEALKIGFFGLHLNEHEAKDLCGSSDFDVLLDFLNGKVTLIALTKGKDGLELFYKNEIYKANIELENIISSVGSGDCLTAGIAYAVSKGMNTKEIAGYGVACGAANCLNADLGMLKYSDVQKLLPKVKCKIIEND